MTERSATARYAVMTVAAVLLGFVSFSACLVGMVFRPIQTTIIGVVVGAMMAMVAYFRPGARLLCGGVIAGTLAVLLAYWLMVGVGLGVQLFS